LECGENHPGETLADSFRYFGDNISEILGDKKWAEKVYKKSEENATYKNELEYLAGSVLDHLEDEKWANLIEQKAEELEDDE
jgi:hypothetical protein